MWEAIKKMKKIELVKSVLGFGVSVGVGILGVGLVEALTGDMKLNKLSKACVWGAGGVLTSAVALIAIDTMEGQVDEAVTIITGLSEEDLGE